jgi:hypothetical protein
MAWLVVLSCGLFLELVGLGVAARGLWQTWKANAPDRPFFPSWVYQSSSWIQSKLLRRKPRTQKVSGHVRATWGFEGKAEGRVWEGFTDEMTLEQMVEVAQSNAIEARKEADEARRAVETERAEREAAMAGVDSRLRGTDEELRSFARNLVVDGVPIAVMGLTLAAVGLVMQGVASIATFS